MTPNITPDRVATLCRIVLAGFEAERAAWKAGLELSSMNVCGPTDPESHVRDVLDWAERGLPDEDEPDVRAAA